MIFCLVSVYITGINDLNATKFAWISLGKDKEVIMFDDMHKFSRSQQVMIKITTIEWFGWWGDICFLWKHCYILSLILFDKFGKKHEGFAMGKLKHY